MSDWRANMGAALAAGGVISQAEWVDRYPGVHCWFDFKGIDSCANCGKVRRRDDKNQPCKGIATIGLRGDQ